MGLRSGIITVGTNCFRVLDKPRLDSRHSSVWCFRWMFIERLLITGIGEHCFKVGSFNHVFRTVRYPSTNPASFDRIGQLNLLILPIQENSETLDLAELQCSLDTIHVS